MAVETILGTYTSTKMAAVPPRTILPQNHEGRVRTHNDVGEFPASSSVTSTISFGKISSSALILSQSKLLYDLLHASATLDLGVKDDSAISLSGKTAALVSATATSSAGSVSALKAVDIDKTGKRLWEILGLATDPKKDLELVVTLAGNAGAGTVAIELLYVID